MKRIAYFLLATVLTACQDSPTSPDENAASILAKRNAPLKVPLCHFDNNADVWTRLTIPEKAANNHLAHHPRDGVPGGDVPEMSGYVFDYGCDPVSFPAPVAYWPFEENGGDIAVDATGRGNNGQLIGDVILGSASGIVGNAVFFGAGDGRIAVPRSSDVNFATEDFTITLWFNSSQSQASLFNTRNTTSCSAATGPSVAGAINPQGIARFSGRASDGVQHNLYSPVEVDDGEWHYFAGVRAGGTMSFYLDGIQVDDETINATADFTTTRDFWIGRSHYCTGSPFEGVLDEFRIYEVALTPEQLNHQFTLGSLN